MSATVASQITGNPRLFNRKDKSFALPVLASSWMSNLFKKHCKQNINVECVYRGFINAIDEYIANE